MRTITPKTKKQVLGGVAAAALAGLLVFPSSGWLVKAQIQMAAGMGGAYSRPAWLDKEKQMHMGGANERAAQAVRVAARNPRDTALHMAAQSWMDTAPAISGIGNDSAGSRRVHQLRPLLPRFGSDPLLHAALLRCLSQSDVTLDDRAEQDLLQSKPSSDPKFYEKKAGANLPENLALWEQSAQAGEQLDKNNAYFPLMHAVGLFAARRDDEALVALQQASEKPVFNDYLAEETQGTWRLIEQAQGEPGYFARSAVQGAQLLPHYARLRAAARLATVKAMQAEMAGDGEKGFQIRMALNRIAARMRTSSTPYIGTLVADAIAPIAWGRPGGAAPFPPATGTLTKEQQDKRTREKMNRYCAYLEKIGHGDATSEVRFEYEAALQTRGLWRAAENTPGNVLDIKPTLWIIAFWAVGVWLLSNALLVLLLGTLATWLTRTKRVQNGLPLHPAVRAGLAATVLLPGLGAGVGLTGPEWLPVLYCIGGAVPVCLGALVFLRRLRGSKTAQPNEKPLRSTLRQNAGLYFATVGIGAVILGSLLLLGSGGATEVVRAASSLFDADPSPSDPLSNPLTGTVVGAAVSLMVSALLFIGLAIHSRIKRVPVSVGVARGFRRWALPVAAALVLVYAGVAVQTLRLEARAKRDLEQCVAKGEGRYLSELLGKPWPGRYPHEAVLKSSGPTK